MEICLDNAEMRAADEYTIKSKGVSSEELMHRAGIAIADEVQSTAGKLNAKSVLVVCGTGNNGGDGYVCASELLKRGICVSVYAFNGNLSADCKREKEKYKGLYSQDICGSIIVDCIFGTGLCREVCGEYAEVIKKINACGAYVISADIPSGLSGDNGLALGIAVKADKTVAIAEYKIGVFLNDGLDCCGEIIKKDIGITCPEKSYVKLITRGDMPQFYPKRKRNSNKGTYGAANIIAGSDKYMGAAALATEAALKSGCGYVKLTTAQSVKLALVAKFPQTIFLDDADLNANAIAIGMGCGVSEELYQSLKFLLDNYGGKLIIDADGLNALSQYGIDILKNKKCEVILTPHIKEFSRLARNSVGEIQTNPVVLAKNFAKEYNVTILLKSASSIITDGEKTAVNAFGTTALAKGGSGDILSGYLCGTLARGLELFNGAVCAAATLGVAAEISSEQKTDYCATAKDVLKNLHLAVARLTR